MSTIQGRAWIAIVYPDSAPSDWRVGLTQTGLKWGCSPLHDKDIYQMGEHKGETKKPHYHILLVWENRTTRKHACEVVQEFCHCSNVLKCESIGGTVKYWDHSEEEDKAVYDPSQICFYNGLDPIELSEIRDVEEDEIVLQIKKIASEKCFLWYSQLDDYLCQRKDDPDLWRYCRKHTLYLRAWFQEKRDRISHTGWAKEHHSDPLTDASKPL